MMTKADSGWDQGRGGYNNRKGSGELLPRALKGIRTKKLLPIHDSVGVCAYETENCILVAKEKCYGDLVSVSNFLIARALDKRLWIVLYLASQDNYYKATAEDIIEKTEYMNHKDMVSMNNFRIKTMTRLK